nr:ABC-F family ATP-binding cassette domain-containing protein [bacterium]
MPSGYVVTLQDVARHFGSNTVIQNATLSLKDGARLGLVGANGAGKTTLMNIIAGLDMPDEGSCSIARGVSIGYLSQIDLGNLTGTVWDGAMDAFAPAWRVGDEMAALEREMQSQSDPAILEDLAGRYAQAQQRFEELGGYMADSLCTGALIGLGFERESFSQPVDTLSGGQMRRLALARLLLQKPDLLLLDEPTNHLDLPAMSYLEGILKAWKGTVILISHDRWFLDAVCTEVAELSFGRLERYEGNYTDYMRQSAERFESRMRAYQLQQREIARQEAIIERYRSFNREKSIRAARSREKLLARVERLENPQSERTLRLEFPPPPHLGQEAVRASGLGIEFDGRTVFKDFDVLIHQGERVAFVGPNGCGKTTLMRLLCGRLAPTMGRVYPGAGMKVGWFDQQQRTLGHTGTVLDELRNEFPRLGDTALRKLLGAFLFPGEDALADLSILSGGERARLMLLKLLLEAPNVLALDEPTNHLDMPSRAALEEALLDWPGTLLFVSHDRFFVDRVATRILFFEDGRLIESLGGWQDYLELQARRAADKAPPVEDRAAKRERLQAEREQIKKRQQRAAEIQRLEDTIQRLEGEKAQLESALADPATYAGGGQAKDIVTRYRALEIELEDAFNRWAELQE